MSCLPCSHRRERSERLLPHPEDATPGPRGPTPRRAV